MNRFNVADIDQTILYVKNIFGAFIIAALERYGFSEPGKKESNFIETMHTDSFKELEITPGPYNATEANYIQDKMVFKYRDIIGEIVFACVAVRPNISFVVEELSKFAYNS